jgi:rod shape-determining protein MreD
MRITLWIVLTFFLQSLCSGLLPDRIPPPDLVFLGALALAAVLPPAWGLLAGFLLGLGQDLLSAGIPGFHAAALLLAVWAFYGLTRWVQWNETLGRFLTLLGAFVAKWLGYLLLADWRHSLVVTGGLGSVFLGELLLTLILAWPFFWLARIVLGDRRE